MPQHIKLAYLSNYNDWEVSGDGEPLSESVVTMIVDMLCEMSIDHCDDEGELMFEELPNESEIIEEVKKMLPSCTIDDEIEYDNISS